MIASCGLDTATIETRVFQGYARSSNFFCIRFYLKFEVSNFQVETKHPHAVCHLVNVISD